MIIWITGGGTGIGREVARQYATQGHQVYISGRTKQSLEEVIESCRNVSGSIHAYPCDVTDLSDVSECYAQIINDHNIPDKIILNAGTHIPDSVDEFKAATLNKLMSVNYMGVVNALDVVLPSLKTRTKKSQIAIVSSVAGYCGLPYAAGYGASKAALINLAQSIKPECERHGIDIRLVNPGFVRTPLTDKNDFDMPFLMEVEDAARAFIGGLEKGGFEIVFPRRLAWILKLLKILPYWLYFKLTRKILR